MSIWLDWWIYEAWMHSSPPGNQFKQTKCFQDRLELEAGTRVNRSSKRGVRLSWSPLGVHWREGRHSNWTLREAQHSSGDLPSSWSWYICTSHGTCRASIPAFLCPIRREPTVSGSNSKESRQPRGFRSCGGQWLKRNRSRVSAIAGYYTHGHEHTHIHTHTTSLQERNKSEHLTLLSR